MATESHPLLGCTSGVLTASNGMQLALPLFDTQATPLDAALDAAAQGIPVLPLHTVVYGRCSCGVSDCRSPGKHPRTLHGLNEATTEATQINKWWAAWPDSN